MKQSSLDESLGMDFEQSDEEMREVDEQQVMDDMGDMAHPLSPHLSAPLPAKGKLFIYYFLYLSILQIIY